MGGLKVDFERVEFCSNRFDGFVEALNLACDEFLRNRVVVNLKRGECHQMRVADGNASRDP
jgi:hypothetical protein